MRLDKAHTCTHTHTREWGGERSLMHERIEGETVEMFQPLSLKLPLLRGLYPVP